MFLQLLRSPSYCLLSTLRGSFFPDPSPGGCPRTPVIDFPIAVFSHRGGAQEQSTHPSINASAPLVGQASTEQAGNPHRDAMRARASASSLPLVENTMPAFRNSAALRVDLLELDVQLTKNQQVVVFHDR